VREEFGRIFKRERNTLPQPIRGERKPASGMNLAVAGRGNKKKSLREQGNSLIGWGKQGVAAEEKKTKRPHQQGKVICIETRLNEPYRGQTSAVPVTRDEEAGL